MASNETPGLQIERNKDGTERHYWKANKKARAHGYAPLSVRIVARTEEDLASQCALLQAEMLEWIAQKEGAADYIASNPTIAAVFRHYRTRPESPFQSVKWNTAETYSQLLDAIEAAAGNVRLSQINLAFLKRLYDDARYPEGRGPGRPDHITKAHKVTSMLRRVFSFGVAAEIEGCERIHTILANTRFEAPGRRSVAMTAEQASSFIAAAIAHGRPSLAIGTALQFECGLRQRDVIGEWEPVPPEGATSAWQLGGRQWVNGLTWAHIGDDWRLTKRTTKTGTVVSHDLTLCPMAFELLAAVLEADRWGPLVIDETAARPYAEDVFHHEWRVIANAAGLPKELRNMDARAGAATEADEAGAALDDIRPTLGHSDMKTTARYVRGTSLAQSRRVAELRIAHRKGSK